MTNDRTDNLATQWKVGARHHGWRLDRFLCERIPKLSRTQIQDAIKDRVSVSWTQQARPSLRVQAGGTVFVAYPRLFEVPLDYSFQILFEDEDVLAINKPAGLVVHPTNSCQKNSVIEAMKRQEKSDELRLVHRLDRETSGILLLAKSRDAARTLGKAIMAKQFQRTYIARVHGKPTSDSGTIAAPIARVKDDPIFVRRAVFQDGVQAETEYRVCKREKSTSLLELFPLTGRCHQLRVHCEHMGWPIVGDPLYGRSNEDFLAYVKGTQPRDRLQLHALHLEGSVGGRHLSIESPLPDFMTDSLHEGTNGES